jgi:hypothetical protein
VVYLLQARELFENLPLPMQIVKIPRSLDHTLQFIARPVLCRTLKYRDSLALIDDEDRPRARKLHEATMILFLRRNDLLHGSCRGYRSPRALPGGRSLE